MNEFLYYYLIQFVELFAQAYSTGWQISRGNARSEAANELGCLGTTFTKS